MIAPLLLSVALAPDSAPRLDAAKVRAAHDHLRAHVRAGRFPGAVTLVFQNGRLVHQGVTGFADPARQIPLRSGSIFQVMSMTKPVTATAALIAVEKGLFGLDDPIENHLPQFRGIQVRQADGSQAEALSRPTIRQLMMHTSGITSDDPGGMSDDEKFLMTLADYASRLGKEPLRAQPGTEIRYSGVGYSTLAAIIERRSGMTFQAFVAQNIFRPLGMKETTFFLPASHRGRLPWVMTEQKGRLIEFPVNRFRAGAKFANGAGGLYSTASDMAAFIESFRAGAPRRLLSEPMRKLALTLQTGDLLMDRTDARGYGLGWSVIRSPRGQNTLRSIGSFGHTGAYGTEYWHDPATGVTVVFLAQTYGVDEGPRRQFSTMVNAALR
jgi:CubicO group peptidase (beta-lactamase class C family)